MPDRGDDLKRFFGIQRTEQVGDNLQEALQFPSLNIRGLQSGDIGDQARTIIPDRAVAEIDVRLVKETDAERMLQRVLAHIRAQGVHVLIDAEPDDETRARYPRIVRVSRVSWTNAYRTEMTLPESTALVSTFERAWGEPPVRTRTMGGTVPIDFFIQALGMPAIGVPVVNFDNNQHSDNENLRLQNLWDAVSLLRGSAQNVAGCRGQWLAIPLQISAFFSKFLESLYKPDLLGFLADFAGHSPVISLKIQPSPQQ